MLSLNPCNLCPRECGIDRTVKQGYCKSGTEIKIARAAPHFWEEPALSGNKGSGTVFFSGCGLRCCYCQNSDISLGNSGKMVPEERLAQIFLELQDKGVHNINLVTATHFVPQVIKAFDIAKPLLHIPVVYNSSGYERVETIKALKGYIDIYLPDIKYYSAALSGKYSGAKDYFEFASDAVKEMVSQTGELAYDSEGVMQKGVIIRHLVLPGGRNDSIQILKWISENLPKDRFLLSLMSQYTPAFKAAEHKEINRKLTSFEYNSVVEEAVRLGLKGYMQQRESAREAYIPPFDMKGV